nr:ATP-binding protein [Ectothiorhodospira haloalkaliphila]
MTELSIEDLDQAAIQEAFGSDAPLGEARLRTLRLLMPYQGRLVPSVGGILLFGRERQWHFADAWVQCGRFRGTEKIDIFDQTDIHEPLPQAVNSIELFLKKHAFKSAEFGAMRRRDVWSIPLTMLREAVVNALVHCDYSQQGSPIRIAFFDDRIEIESPGLLMPGMTIDEMKRGVSMIRNPVIARVFRELGLIEQWGSGVKRIFAEAAVQGLPEPHIEEIANRIRMSVWLAAPVVVPENAPVTQSVTQSDALLPMLQLLREGSQSSGELRRHLELRHRAHFRRHYLVPALQRGLIEMTLPETPNSRLQQYRLTAKGQQYLKDLT